LCLCQSSRWGRLWRLDPEENCFLGDPASRIEVFAASVLFVTVLPSQAGHMTQT
jgi:hypothetical protein